MIGQMIDQFFHPFDIAILTMIHNLAVTTHNAFEVPCEIISFFFSHGGIPVIIILLGLIYYRPTRKVAFCIAVSLILGVLMTNLYIKNVVVRARPYNSTYSFLYDWWEFAGAHVESEFSFPSGHTTAMSAIVVTCICMLKSKWRYFLFLGMPLMGFARCYLMVHYPSDIIGGIIVGSFAGYLGYRLGTYLYSKRKVEEKV